MAKAKKKVPAHLSAADKAALRRIMFKVRAIKLRKLKAAK